MTKMVSSLSRTGRYDVFENGKKAVDKKEVISKRSLQ
jgi:hypothetical protein